MDISTVEEIHFFLVNYFGDSEDPISPPGIKSQSLLESACARPFSTAGGRDVFEDEFEKAAALFHAIISNHCFHNGNKRTALLSALYFLGDNNIWMDRCEDEEMFEFTRKTAAHEICDNREDEVKIVTEWLQRNSRRVVKGDRRLSFWDLKEILKRFGYELEGDGNTLDVSYEGQVVTKILKKGKHGFEEYDAEYIAELRKRLNLTVAFGIDSARFYGQKGITNELNDYMDIHHQVFRWLAKI